MVMRPLVVFSALAVILLWFLPASAQSDGATVSGRNTDRTGLALGDVKVRVANVETSVTLARITNNDGSLIDDARDNVLQD